MGVKEDVLLSLVQGPIAEAWANSWAKKNRGWVRDSDLDGCGWERIRCDADYSVTTILFTDVGIIGTIPTGLRQFTNLVVFNFPGNSLFGTVPEGVLALQQLVMFNVEGSRLEGDFPLFQSKELNFLSIEGNNFGGELPNDLGDRMPRLITVNLGNNSFVGTLPKSVTALSNLGKFNVSHNRLVGTIPDELGNLVNLDSLILNNNGFIGTIPRSLARPHSKLEQLFLQHNAFSGSIPADLAEIPHLSECFLNGNKLTGIVPHELCQKPMNDVYFSEIENASSRDGCEALACPVNSQSVEGIFPCEFCPKNTISPYLGHNGRCITVDQRRILESFYYDAGGRKWNGAPRWMNPNVPVCLYEGIDCNEGGDIVNISLPRMNLHGTINDKLGRLRHLRVLNLEDNYLTGYIPSDLRFSPLEYLDLGGNQLQGPVPPMLCLAGGVNGNGDRGSYRCDAIACPAGTWHPRGFRLGGRGSCIPCPGRNSNLIGQRSCGLVAMSSFESVGQAAHNNLGYVGLAIISIFVLITVLGIVVVSRNRRMVGQKGNRLGDINGSRLDEEIFEDEAYSVEAEELTIIFNSQRKRAPSPNLAVGTASIASIEDSAVVLTPRRRDHSHDDDSDTQDLWLDVPKIT